MFENVTVYLGLQIVVVREVVFVHCKSFWVSHSSGQGHSLPSPLTGSCSPLVCQATVDPSYLGVS